MVGRVEDYAIVSDMQSVALMCAEGSVDWQHRRGPCDERIVPG